MVTSNSIAHATDLIHVAEALANSVRELWKLPPPNGTDGLFESGLQPTAPPAHDLHQLFDLSALIGLAAGGNRSFHAMGDVVAQELLFHPV